MVSQKEIICVLFSYGTCTQVHTCSVVLAHIVTYIEFNRNETKHVILNTFMYMKQFLAFSHKFDTSFKSVLMSYDVQLCSSHGVCSIGMQHTGTFINVTHLWGRLWHSVICCNVSFMYLESTCNSPMDLHMYTCTCIHVHVSVEALSYQQFKCFLTRTTGDGGIENNLQQ